MSDFDFFSRKCEMSRKGLLDENEERALTLTALSIGRAFSKSSMFWMLFPFMLVLAGIAMVVVAYASS